MTFPTEAPARLRDLARAWADPATAVEQLSALGALVAQGRVGISAGDSLAAGLNTGDTRVVMVSSDAEWHDRVYRATSGINTGMDEAARLRIRGMGRGKDRGKDRGKTDD